MGCLGCFLVVLLGRRSRTAMEMLARGCLWGGQGFALGFFLFVGDRKGRPYMDFAMWWWVGRAGVGGIWIACVPKKIFKTCM